MVPMVSACNYMIVVYTGYWVVGPALTHAVRTVLHSNELASHYRSVGRDNLLHWVPWSLMFLTWTIFSKSRLILCPGWSGAAIKTTDPPSNASALRRAVSGSTTKLCAPTMWMPLMGTRMRSVGLGWSEGMMWGEVRWGEMRGKMVHGMLVSEWQGEGHCEVTSELE